MATVTDGRTLPFDWYSDPAVLRLERERIFRRSWQYAGRADQVAGAGAFFTCEAGDIPIVVVRDREGVLRAFVNVCRHRGSLVCEGEGRRETLQCPYHAWTYDLDGSLRAAPRSDREPGFEKEELGLVPVRVEAWGPFVFVNPDVEAAPLAELLGELPELARGRRDRARLAPLPAPLALAVRGELEGLLRELPRVLPLPGRPSRLLEGRRRLGRRLRARREPLVLVAVRPRSRGAARHVRPQRPDRARAVPLRLAEPDDQRDARAAEPLDRPRAARRAGADGALPRLLRRPGCRRGVDRGDDRVRRAGRRGGHRPRRARAEGAAGRRRSTTAT